MNTYSFKDAISALAKENNWHCAEPLECKNCGCTDTPNIEFNQNNSGWKATCSSCGLYIKFVSHVYIVSED